MNDPKFSSISKNENHQTINIGPISFKNFKVIGKWTKFLSIAGFIIYLLVGILFLYSSMEYSNFYGYGNISIIYFLLYAINIIPLIFLLMFSNNISNSMLKFNDGKLELAIKYLKWFFISQGIILIIALILFIFIIWGGILS